ncbi:MAG: hypothetical protein CMR00_01965 [[Chlorobium] sp. 445]|nr:MAG: hypothetical protein CMR00_01965 [[Chlorobium] sp. 445]
MLRQVGLVSKASAHKYKKAVLACKNHFVHAQASCMPKSKDAQNARYALMLRQECSCHESNMRLAAFSMSLAKPSKCLIFYIVIHQVAKHISTKHKAKGCKAKPCL